MATPTQAEPEIFVTAVSLMRRPNSDERFVCKGQQGKLLHIASPKEIAAMQAALPTGSKLKTGSIAIEALGQHWLIDKELVAAWTQKVTPAKA